MPNTQRRRAAEIGGHAEERDALEAADADRRASSRRSTSAYGWPVQDGGSPLLRLLVGAGALVGLIEVEEVEAEVDRGALLLGQPGRVVVERRRVVGLGHEGAGPRLGLAAVAGHEQAAGARAGAGRRQGQRIRPRAAAPRHTSRHIPPLVVVLARRRAGAAPASRWVNRSATATGVTPLIRDAWPSERGRSALELLDHLARQAGDGGVVEIVGQRAPRRARASRARVGLLARAGSPRT